MEEVLCGLAEADSARSVQQRGAVLLALLQKARQRHHDITTQEMTVLIDERDRTATRVRFHGYSRGCVSTVTAGLFLSGCHGYIRVVSMVTPGLRCHDYRRAVFPRLRQGCVAIVKAGLRFHGYGGAAFPRLRRGHVTLALLAAFPWLPQGCVSMVTACSYLNDVH